MSDTEPEVPEGMTELYDADVPRVDLVSAAANGFLRPIIAKQADGAPGLLDAGFVRSLIAKAGPEPIPQETVTMTGSPAAIAAMIHQAAVRKTRQEVEADGATEKTETNVTKDMGVMEMDDIDLTEILAEPEIDAPGNPTSPGSPAWEATDAATARKWTSILARARAALGAMADREALEAATGDESDIDNAMDLDDAACAIDYAISVLAPFAVDEQAEADCGTDEMEMLGKALAGFDTAALETLEAFAPLRKAGRALSSANEAAIRAALTSLETILASLPKAPDAPAPDKADMQKESEPMGDNPEAVQNAIESSHMLGTPKEPADAERPAAADMPGHVAKAAKPDQMAVYDSDGNLVGVVDPGDVTRLMSAKAPAPASVGDDGDTDGGMAGDGQTAADADDGTTPEDLAPAPADAVGTPADAPAADDDGNVAKAATPDTVPTGMLKSSIQDLVKAALDERSAEQAELYKGLEDRNRALEERNEALTRHVEDLKADIAKQAEKIDVLANAPAVMAIASNGAVPPAHLMRGQDRGGQPDLSHAELLKAKFRTSDDARETKRIADEMQELAIAKFSAMQRRQ